MNDRIANLKEWASKQTHLPQKIDNNILKSFLIGCKYDLETSKKKLDAYFSARLAMPHIFSGRDPTSAELKMSVDYHAHFVLSSLFPNSYVIVFGKILDWNDQNFSVLTICRKLTVIMDCLLREVRLNSVIIVDCQGFEFRHTSLIDSSLFQDMALVLKEAFPFNVFGIYLLNTTSFLDSIIKLFWPLVPEEIKNKVHFCSNNIEELYNRVTKKLLPNEYGGQAGTVRELNESYHRKLERIRDIFLQRSDEEADEFKRRNKSIFSETTQNPKINNFRKMDID